MDYNNVSSRIHLTKIQGELDVLCMGGQGDQCNPTKYFSERGKCGVDGPIMRTVGLRILLICP